MHKTMYIVHQDTKKKISLSFFWRESSLAFLKRAVTLFSITHFVTSFSCLRNYHPIKFKMFGICTKFIGVKTWEVTEELQVPGSTPNTDAISCSFTTEKIFLNLLPQSFSHCLKLVYSSMLLHSLFWLTSLLFFK